MAHYNYDRLTALDMVDGVSGVDLVTVLLSPKPDAVFKAPRPWIPRPAPSRLALTGHEPATARRQKSAHDSRANGGAPAEL